MSATAQSKIDATISRLDAMLDQRLRSEEAEQARADASLKTPAAAATRQR